MRSTRVTTAYACLLATLFVVAFFCPLLEAPHSVHGARILSLLTGTTLAWLCLRRLPSIQRD